MTHKQIDTALIKQMRLLHAQGVAVLNQLSKLSGVEIDTDCDNVTLVKMWRGQQQSEIRGKKFRIITYNN